MVECISSLQGKWCHSSEDTWASWHIKQKVNKANSMFAPIQWETSIQTNTISYWLGANLESSLVKSLFSAHIQAQSSALQIFFTSTFAGHWNLWNLSSRVPIYSWVERNNEAWIVLLRGTMSRNTGTISNSGHDLDPDRYACNYYYYYDHYDLQRNIWIKEDKGKIFKIMYTNDSRQTI